MPGPRPTPTHLKLLRGNPGKQRLNKFEPQPEVPQEPPSAPSVLTGHAADEWWRIITELHRLKLVTPIDVNVLAAYCQSYKRWREAEEVLARMAANDPVMCGLVIRSADGNPMQNPLVRVSERAADAMVRYAAEFGMTPAARSRIAAGVGSQPPGAGKFTGLLGG